MLGTAVIEPGLLTMTPLRSEYSTKGQLNICPFGTYTWRENPSLGGGGGGGNPRIYKAELAKVKYGV
jgi:hypothetical protein